MKQTTLFLAIGAWICFSSSAFAQDVPRPTDEQLQNLKSVDYSPYPQQHFPNKVYFGASDHFIDRVLEARDNASVIKITEQGEIIVNIPEEEQ